MIVLTKLDRSSVLVSVEAIKYMEAVPDTLINFLNGDSLIVRENFEEVMACVVNYKARIVSASRDVEGNTKN